MDIEDVMARARADWYRLRPDSVKKDATIDAHILTALREAGYVVVPVEPSRKCLLSLQLSVSRHGSVSTTEEIFMDSDDAREIYKDTIAAAQEASDD